MQDYGRELTTGPSPTQDHNRDFLRSVELKNQLRNSGLAKFFHTAVPNSDEFRTGFILEDNSRIFIGLENYDRISEE